MNQCDCKKMSIFISICGLGLASSCKYSRIKYCDLLPSCESHRERLIRMVVMVIMRNMIFHNLTIFILIGSYHLLTCHTHIYGQICSLNKNLVFPFPFVLVWGPQKTKPEIKQYVQDFTGTICSTRRTKHGRREIYSILQLDQVGHLLDNCGINASQ